MKQTEVAAVTYEKTKNTVKVALLAAIALAVGQLLAMATRKKGQ